MFRLFCLLFLFTVSNPLFSFLVEENIKQLSFREKYYLKAFFNKSIKYDHAGHALYFNTKPATLIAIVLESRGKKIKQEMQALKGWSIFKNHQDLFPHPNFIFSETFFNPAEDLSVLHIYMINKITLKRCLAKYDLYFKAVLGLQFSADEFINGLEKGIPLPTLINNNDLLMGLILGFGEDASKAFSDRISLTSQTATQCCINLKKPQGCKISPIVFMGDPNSIEVKELSLIYEQELSEIWNEYRESKKPLNMVLKKLCNSDLSF